MTLAHVEPKHIILTFQDIEYAEKVIRISITTARDLYTALANALDRPVDSEVV